MGPELFLNGKYGLNVKASPDHQAISILTYRPLTAAEDALREKFIRYKKQSDQIQVQSDLNQKRINYLESLPLEKVQEIKAECLRSLEERFGFINQTLQTESLNQKQRAILTYNLKRLSIEKEIFTGSEIGFVESLIQRLQRHNQRIDTRLNQLKLAIEHSQANLPTLENRLVSELPLEKSESGHYQLSTDQLLPLGTLYRLRITNKNGYIDEISDPGAASNPEGILGPSEIYDPAIYQYDLPNWKIKADEKPIIYQLHVGFFSKEGTFDAAADRIIAKKKKLETQGHRLPYNTVLLHPLSFFDPLGKDSFNWGYDAISPLHIAEAYGGPQGFARFIDRLAQHGIGVGVDWVAFNHLDNRYKDFEALNPDNVLPIPEWANWSGYAINYQGTAKHLLPNMLRQFLHTYPVTFIRFDSIANVNYSDNPKEKNHFFREVNTAHSQIIKQVNEKRRENGLPTIYSLAEVSEECYYDNAVVDSDHGLGYNFKTNDSLVKWILGRAFGRPFEKDDGYSAKCLLDTINKGGHFRAAHGNTKSSKQVTYAANHDFMRKAIQVRFSERKDASGMPYMIPFGHGTDLLIQNLQIRRKEISYLDLIPNSLYRLGLSMTYLLSDSVPMISATHQWAFIRDPDGLPLRYENTHHALQRQKEVHSRWENDSQRAGTERIMVEAAELRRRVPAISGASIEQQYIYDRYIESGVLAVRRWAKRPESKKSEVMILINTTDQPYPKYNFSFMVSEHTKWREIFNTDELRFGGTGLTNTHLNLQSSPDGHDETISLGACSFIVFERDS
ncbi:MAG: alpha amylase C-terminal domain-containing protein [Candidatus Caenarcaniphilales bacterium]|nr:alpha amylase C-terminal domain-containing protein [Candidatus Caenarcaniphilales bacterium]